MATMTRLPNTLWALTRNLESIIGVRLANFGVTIERMKHTELAVYNARNGTSIANAYVACGPGGFMGALYTPHDFDELITSIRKMTCPETDMEHMCKLPKEHDGKHYDDGGGMYPERVW